MFLFFCFLTWTCLASGPCSAPGKGRWKAGLYLSWQSAWAGNLGCQPYHCTNWVRKCLLVIPSLGKGRQEDLKPKVILGYIMHSKPACLKKQRAMGWKDMVKCLQLLQDPNSVPSTHIVQLITTGNSSPRASYISVFHRTHIHSQRCTHRHRERWSFVLVFVVYLFVVSAWYNLELSEKREPHLRKMLP